MSIIVLHDRPQADGSRWTTYTISLAVGHSVDIGPTRVPVGVSAEDHGVTMEARWAPRLIASEKEKDTKLAISGKLDPKKHVPVLNSQAAFQQALVTRLFDLMTDEDTDEDKYAVIKKAYPVAALFTDAEVSTLVGWTVAEVAAARAKLATFADALTGLDHGKGRIA